VQSPKSDIYVALLAIALGAMVVGCLFLILVWNRYEFKVKPTALAPSSAVFGLLEPASGKIFSTVRL